VIKKLKATELNWSVTPKSLRKAEACVSGYNKLVCALSGKTFNAERETYILFKHDEPISIAYILESNGFDDALWATQCVAGADRDLRLFAVWCARQVQHLMTDERSITALDVAEKFANGQASEAELDAAMAATRAAAWDAAWDAARDAAMAAAWAAAMAATRAAALAAARGGKAAAAMAAQREMFVRMLNGTAPWQKGSE
jgi:hypothetical protein